MTDDYESETVLRGPVACLASGTTRSAAGMSLVEVILAILLASHLAAGLLAAGSKGIVQPFGVLYVVSGGVLIMVLATLWIRMIARGRARHKQGRRGEAGHA